MVLGSPKTVEKWARYHQNTISYISYPCLQFLLTMFDHVGVKVGLGINSGQFTDSLRL
jgi:hypothetical protein